LNRIRALHSKKERQLTGLTLLEGERLVLEALEQGVRMDAVLGLPEVWGANPAWVHRLASAGISTFTANSKQLQMLTATEHAPGLMAVVSRPAWSAESLWTRAGEPGFLGVLAVGIQDPGNLGTILRTLAAANGRGAWLSAGCAEVSSPKVLRSSAGAVLRLPGVEQADPGEVIGRCRELGILTLAAVPRGGRVHTSLDLTQPMLLVLGAEGEGLDTRWVEACQQPVHIPMPGGTESLNVSVAAGIILYEAVRQRRLAPAANGGPKGGQSTGEHTGRASSGHRADQGSQRTRRT
jgi:TrmH family RNA methyltransferase